MGLSFLKTSTRASAVTGLEGSYQFIGQFFLELQFVVWWDVWIHQVAGGLGQQYHHSLLQETQILHSLLEGSWRAVDGGTLYGRAGGGTSTRGVQLWER